MRGRSRRGKEARGDCLDVIESYSYRDEDVWVSLSLLGW